MVPLVRQVMKQTRARIFRGNTRSEGKLVSLFEPSTEIIRKGKASKPTEFGKMVKLQRWAPRGHLDGACVRHFAFVAGQNKEMARRGRTKE
jgi:hypothetical protein